MLLSLVLNAAYASPFAFITNTGSNSVTVIDTMHDIVVATVPVGATPFGVAANLNALLAAYVVNSSGNEVSVMHQLSHAVVATVGVETLPQGVAANREGTRIYVANSGSNNVSVINTRTVPDTLITNVPVGGKPIGIAVNDSGTRVYVANSTSNTISVIDTATNTVVDTVPVGDFPYGVAVNPAGTRVYVSNSNGNSVSVIDTVTNFVVATVFGFNQPRGIAVNPAGSRVYAANFGGNSVSVVNPITNNILTTVPVGAAPLGISVDPGGTRAYVANSGSNNVSVINTRTNTVENTIGVGIRPAAFGRFISTYFGLPVMRPPPSEPIIASVVPGNGEAYITFIPSLLDGGLPITSYTATCNPGGFTVTGAPPLLTVTGLSNGTTYTCSLIAINSGGDQNVSAPSNSLTVTPRASSGTTPLGIEVVSSLNPSVTGQAVTLTAILQGHVDDGTVAFRNGATVLATVPVIGPPPLCNPIPGSVCVTNSTTRISFTSQLTASMEITATYNGNASYAPSTSRPYLQKVFPALFPNLSVRAITATGSADAFLEFSGGGASCRFQRADWISLRSVDMTPGDYASITSQYAFPHGLFEFVTTSCTPGATLNFTLSFYQPSFRCPIGAICPAVVAPEMPVNIPTNSVYWKYGPTPNNPVPHWYVLPATMSGNTISFNITDGGLGDDDLTVNGVIVDQGGPGVPITATPIPSTSKSTLFVLSGILLFAGLMIMRHRRISLFH